MLPMTRYGTRRGVSTYVHFDILCLVLYAAVGTQYAAVVGTQSTHSIVTYTGTTRVCACVRACVRSSAPETSRQMQIIVITNRP